MKKYYAVMDETNKLIYESWDEVLKILPKLIKPKYKSFSTKEAAQAYLAGEVKKNIDYECSAYIDGSYNPSTEEYSFGGVLLINGNEYKFKKRYEADMYSKMRNVAGELKGAGYIINYCVNHNIKEIHIYYDYEGIESWYTGKWKAKSPISIEYVKFLNSVKDKIIIHFHKVKSHTNDYYNDLADKLAKEALGI